MIKMIIRMARIMARITHVPNLFSMERIFGSEYSFVIYTDKKERKKKFEFEQSSWRHKLSINKKNVC